MKCPNCGLENVKTAIKCDCGYYFQTNKIEKKSIDKIQKIAVKSIKNIYVSGLIGFIVIGIFIILSAILQSIEGVLNADQISSNIAFNRVLIGVSLILFGNLIWIIVCKCLAVLLNIQALLISKK